MFDIFNISFFLFQQRKDSMLKFFETEYDRWLGIFTVVVIISMTYAKIPGCKLTPKFHNILHYWENALEFGPIYRHSSYKYERFHQLNKRSISTSKNMKNPSYSMVNFIQKKNCSYTHERKFFWTKFLRRIFGKLGIKCIYS